MDTKIIGVILLFCSALLFQYGYDDLREYFFSPEEKLQSTIQKDIKNALKNETKQKSEPKIHHVEIKYRSVKPHEYLFKHQPSFPTSKSGTVWLEIEVLDLPDDENPGFITQTSVFDLKTKNKISEFGQTYYFKDFGEHKEAAKQTIEKAIEQKTTR